MEVKFGFTKFTIKEFESWIKEIRVGRTILKIQQHHTYSPSYIHFKGANHFEIQRGMKNYHVTHNGWSDIGQHLTIFPDGSIMTGRSMEKSPACITGQNANSICIESIGNFDLNGDTMSQIQKDSIVAVTSFLCSRFSLSITTNSIVYHHWFNLRTGERNNGVKNNKSCPGTNFFGGNKVIDCEKNFLPLIKQKLLNISNNQIVNSNPKYVVVTTKSLNIRSFHSVTSEKVKGRSPVLLGSVLRIFEEKEGWLRISNSMNHWIAGKYTTVVSRATVNSDTLNVRSGPNVSFAKIGSYLKGEEVFVIEEEKGWCKISMDERWVNKKYLNF